ncbi:serine/threonine-protein kinase TBK1-like isoform X2 [Babylonia areolata]|uniref:serine/threonine-protein kinase TBK1-like isoform X1 n=1 Tax=Babylonia areolata TaxID=304850 RepID=UPI003FD1CA51
MATLRGSKNYVWDTNKPLGQGATSMVYVGREKRTGEEVAVKVFTPQSYQRPRQVQIREFEVMKRLNHENIVRLLAIEEEQTMNGGEVIVMEMCPNGSLYNVLECSENSYGLCEEEFLLVLKQVAAGVKHLRDNDIIHRDIKPGNILRCVAEDGRSIYKLTDFGAARELQDNEEFMSLYGTEEYLHPDMYAKAVLRHGRGQQFGVHVDLWSLGVTFYHAATGNLPFRPYGGRRNKETMHVITTQKEPGVISGVQMTENGPIDYRKELPNTCKLSLGLKRLLTPFLAALLEKDPSRTWPFDHFFQQVNAITSKVVVHAFCLSLLLPMKVYADRTDSLQRLKELIGEQTDIPPGSQLLLLGGQRLSTLVQPTQPLGHYNLDISPTNPIMVFCSTTASFPQRPYSPGVGQFPQLTQAVAVDHDYPQCKRCCGVLHSIIEAVRINTETTTLVNMAVQMFCSHLQQQVAVVQESQGRLEQQMGVVSHWQHSIGAQLSGHLDLLRLTHAAAGPAMANVAKWVKVIQAAQQTHMKECDAQFQKLQASCAEASSQLQEAISVQNTVRDWDTTLSCTPADRCVEKLKVLQDRMRKILTMFKDNRTKRILNYNDEQIHKFEKNKLSELCTQARSMFTDNCMSKRKNLFKEYKNWLDKATRCQMLVSKVGSTMSQINEGHTQLVAKLKNVETRCCKLVEDCVDHLKKEVATSQLTQAIPMPPTTTTTNTPAAAVINGSGRQVNGSGGQVMMDMGGGGGQFSGTPALSSRQERLDSLLDGLHSSRKSLEELEMLVSENTQLIRNFGSLTAEEERNGDMA